MPKLALSFPLHILQYCGFGLLFHVCGAWCRCWEQIYELAQGSISDGHWQPLHSLLPASNTTISGQASMVHNCIMHVIITEATTSQNTVQEQHFKTCTVTVRTWDRFVFDGAWWGVGGALCLVLAKSTGTNLINYLFWCVLSARMHATFVRGAQ